MDQTIRFLTTGDGVKLAYAASGSGPPLLKTANWLNHLEFDWQSPVWSHWFRLFSTYNTFYRYDIRGSGLSDWTGNRLSFEDQVADLECVVDAAGLDKFALLGISQGSAVAIEYAVRHPERVTHLVMHGGFAQGWARRGPESERAGRAWVELVRVGWGTKRTDAYRRMFAELFIPCATEEQMDWFTEMQRRSTTPELAARIMEASGNIDVLHRLSQVRTPSLVMHPRRDVIVPFDQGRVIAGGIANAKFVELDSGNHVLLDNEPAWQRFQDVVAEFLGWQRGTPARRAADRRAESEDLAALTGREREILSLVAGGASNQAIADQLFISEKTVRNHLTAIFDKLGVSSRSQAIVFARDRGLAGRAQ
jgi:pimeloyl-ACP methyl ester carboxylesterase/DNA-binding CsgD family transcriptional regulator